MYKINVGVLSLIVIIFIGCENNTISYDNGVNNLNRKSLLRPDNKLDELFPEKLAAKFIEKAQDRIDKVTEKANEKSDKVDISTVEEILLIANEMLQDAKDAFTAVDYELALDLAKDAKEIANQAMEALEDLTEEYESIEDAEEDGEDEEEEDEEDENEYTDDNIDFELKYNIGETTSVEIESNITLTDEIFNLINQVAMLITNNAQEDVEIKLKLELKDGELELKLNVDDALTTEQESIINQIENAIIDIFNNTNYEDFKVEIEIELELEDDEEENDDNDDNDDNDNNGNNDSADQALKFIDQAQNKIDKATDKADKKNTPAIDLTDVYAKIQEAEDKLKEAQNAYDNGDYGNAIDLAKEAKELASEALEILEDILEAADDDGDDDGDDDDDDD